MAASAQATIDRAPSSRAGFESRWANLLAPSYFDFFIVALVIWLFGVGEGWRGLVLDGDTGWHIRTGEYIIQNGSVPKADLFSYSKPGQPWFAWEWLADIIYAVLHSRFGLAGVAALSGLMICATAAILLRHMLWRGANSFAALLMTLVFIGAGSLHYHARPHIFTLVFLAIFAWVVERDRVSPSKWVWLLIPFVAIWTNLHGGFLVGVAYAGLTTAGTALKALVTNEADRRVGPRQARVPAPRETLRYATLTAGCLLASIANPYGIGLHQHIVSYLQSDFIRNVVQEFKSPVFRGESAIQYEAVLISGLLITGLLLARKAFPEAFLVVYFAHTSLTSARHVPLYVIVATPIVARELTRLWDSMVSAQSRKSIWGILDQISIDFGSGFHRWTVWCPAGVAAVMLFTPADRWPKDFAVHFPDKMVARYGDLIAASRVFTSDQWGDYLIYHLYPKQRVFVDGRSDFYGEKLGNEYISLMNLDHNWETVLARYDFDLVLTPVKWPLSSALKLSPKWRIVADDGFAILFSRASSDTNGQKTQAKGLMERSTAAEGTRRDPVR